MTGGDATTAYWARWKFARLALPLQQRARELGYNLVVHGSLARDIDLVAIPWIEEAVSADELVAALIETTKQHNDGVAYVLPRSEGGSSSKPHGRRAWSIFLLPDDHCVYLDVSVMPRREG